MLGLSARWLNRSRKQASAFSLAFYFLAMRPARGGKGNSPRTNPVSEKLSIAAFSL